jgi:HlyD family secretion protein
MKMATGKLVFALTTLTMLSAAPLFAQDTTAQGGDAAKPALNAPAIVVAKVSSRELTDHVLASGTIQPEEEVYVQPLVEGLSIKALAFDVGDHVKAGDTLATLTDDALLLQKSQLIANKAKVGAARAQLQAQLLDSKSVADEAKRQADRAATLAKAGTVSTSQADQLAANATGAAARVVAAEEGLNANDADLKVVESQIDDIDLKLSRTAVKAPVDGLISARNAKVGAIASGAGQPLFTIIKNNAVELKADLAEEDIIKIAPGQKVQISLPGATKTLDGKVLKIEPTVNATTRLGTVEIHIDNTDVARAGMYAQADIIVAQRNGLALPITAVTTGDKDTSARLVKDGVIHIVPVTTGIQDGGFLEITSGLQLGDQVVAKAGAYVREGDHVRPVTELSKETN